ncbi:potassium/proton antiporter [Tistrella mobilis]|uniref:potassium/proton antiporter n=2 Tax=Tistrella mobilis TaxID=171437 RepID=UPI0035575246
MELANQLIFVGAALVLISIGASLVSSRFGMPLLLVFLLLGLAAGPEGLGGIVFADIDSAALIGSLALAVILFDGGLKTKGENFRVALWPATSLATVGVLITAGLTGLIGWALFDQLGLMAGLLLGAILSPTDAAAVFFLLGSRGLVLKERVGATLEIESGSNDPMAVFLTIGLVELLVAGAAGGNGLGVVELAGIFVLQMGLGAGFGLVAGHVLGLAINRLRLASGLYPLLALAGALFTFGLTAVLGGSGFLAVYLMGLMLGNRKLQGFHNIMRFHDGLTWLAQIVMFLMLGLMVLPSGLIAIAPLALPLAFVLMLVVRPIAVWVSLLPFNFSKAEQAFISWVGLRGAVPMVLALFPTAAGLDVGPLYFGIAFWVVVVSLTIQGWTITPLARWLKLEIPSKSGPIDRIEISLPELPDHEIVGYAIEDDSPLVDRHPRLPPWAQPLLLVREKTLTTPAPGFRLAVGDTLYLLAPPWKLPDLDAVFGGRAEEDAAFFGAFTLNGDARLSGLGDAYGVPVPAEALRETLADFIDRQFNRAPVVGDVVFLGNVALIVRERDETGRVTKVGLDLDGLKRRAPRVPFLPDWPTLVRAARHLGPGPARAVRRLRDRSRGTTATPVAARPADSTRRGLAERLRRMLRRGEK